jgi:hypothetical protein
MNVAKVVAEGDIIAIKVHGLGLRSGNEAGAWIEKH